jgi:hypothetical protein
VFDEYMGMPEAPWLPVSSFQTPATPPAAGPLSGTLVQLPCINADWLPLVLGALDQLRNPSAWSLPYSGAAMDSILSQVDELRDACNVITVPCVSCPLIRLQDCVLQSSCDGGATWVDVSGWASNFASCVQLAYPGPVPPNPGGRTPADQACSIAGYISSEIIKLAITNAVNSYNSSLSLLQFGVLIFDTIAFAFPITAIAVDVFYALYLEVNGSTISDFTDAESDPALWNAVTCAIYSAIATDGAITAANLPTVISNVCGISYVHADVVTAICNFMTNIGLANIRAMQNVGVLDELNCTHCAGGWCFNTEFNNSAIGLWQYFNPINQSGHWVPHVGIVADNFFAGNYYATMKITYPARTIQGCYASWNAPFGVVAANTFCEILLGGVVQGTIPLTNGVLTNISAFTGDELVVQVAGGSHSVTLLRVQLQDAAGTNPFGPDNC